MISFPNAKINLGLYITKKRKDGFHEIKSIMVPSGPKDILEFVPSKDGREHFSLSGLDLESPGNDNLVIKALHNVRKLHAIPPLKIHLHKNIPFGAGLGGGSADAAFMIKMLNEHFGLEFSRQDLMKIASETGSDCTFFINNEASLVSGKGDQINPVEWKIPPLHLVLLFPEIKISTPEAYRGIVPAIPGESIIDIVENPPDQWRNTLFNDFESVMFPPYPFLRELKEKLYKNGAVYASMSGSGSAIYGLFKDKPDLPEELRKFIIHEGPIIAKNS